MTGRNARRRQPLWAAYRAARHATQPDRLHRGVHHRHGFVFGFPNCSAAQLDEYLDDTGPIND